MKKILVGFCLIISIIILVIAILPLFEDSSTDKGFYTENTDPDIYEKETDVQEDSLHLLDSINYSDIYQAE